MILVSSLNGFLKKIPEPLRRAIRGTVLPVDICEVHIEQIETTYNRLVKWIKLHSEAMLMLTFSSNPLTSLTSKLYSSLIRSFANPIGLHVHIRDDLNSPPLPLPSYTIQHNTIKNGLETLKKLGVQTIDFTSGHWSYNIDTFAVCKKLRLKNVHIKLKEIPKITLAHGIPKGIRLIPVIHHIHDYET